MVQAIVFLPLIGALIAGLFGTLAFKQLGRDADVYTDHAHAHDDHGDHGHDDHGGHYHGPRWPMLLTTGLLVIGAVLSWIIFVGFLNEGHPQEINLLTWINSGTLQASWAIRLDALTAVMLVVVNTVSALVHIYSLGYMSHDEHQPRFFAYLSLFTFAMLMLVTANNLIQMFFGWEGVGLASYLLIGFWYTRESANAAAIKAFVVNRVGDFGFALGIFGVFMVYGSVEFPVIFAHAPDAVGKTIHFLGHDFDTLTTLCMLLFMGAMGKSAQFLLHTWLPDAMEGPTPVSALIHAATMVTAGVFLVARMSPLFELSPDARMVVTLVGGITAFFAATVGLVQNDIKRVIAYSTCSQLGYMFVALGVGAYGAGVFHLFTHAFFKALLFLGAGSVIHAMSGEQDMRKMGGLAPHIRITWLMMLIGTFALTGVGIPGVGGFAGFYSKDAIIEAAWAAETASGHFAFALLVIAAFCTSFYSWRLAFMTFNGPTRADKDVIAHSHESPPVMLVPLFVLAAGAVIAGVVFEHWFIGEGQEHFWNGAVSAAQEHIFHAMHEVPLWVKWSATVAMVSGFGLAVLFYLVNPALPKQLAAVNEPAYKFLLNKWYFDELYDAIFVKPAYWIGRLFWKGGDGAIIDGLGPDGVSARVVDVTRGVVRLQTGYLYHYAFVMLIGVAAIISWFSFGGSH
ncbi:NADH-quinone oxidoreductase subunit L [Aestuariivirga litoralis]|uniref:NADH-quinone oxidoreductase subunit L n=1 Tax=Aestuariivirga litoralis TaxID=2650924 RepID=UPI0018C7ACA2|nr:NADH-quinone oxidoreductase subunit L [Aestuariivirga litoralis]MBG1231835.1 NADH-quinone oxidoreductase subunit L [Aestuariivirga litoralis]